MKIDVTTYNPPDSTHPWEPAEFVRHYNRLIESLVSAGRTPFTDIVIGRKVTNTIPHNVNYTVNHGLGITNPSLAISGRVVAWIQVGGSDQNVIIRASLWGSRLVNPSPNTSTDKLEVEETTLFRVGDKVLVGDKQAIIKFIQPTTLTLGYPIIYPKNSYSVTLFQDNVTFTIF